MCTTIYHTTRADSHPAIDRTPSSLAALLGRGR